ncbi:MAG: hypothetical protein ACOH5I_11775 [Oligoflexus sp.]
MRPIRYLSMTIFILCQLTQACATKVSMREIQICRLHCDAKGGLHQMVLDPFQGTGCHCRSSDILWLDMGEEGAFEDYRDLGEEYEMFRDMGSEPEPQ